MSKRAAILIWFCFFGLRFSAIGQLTHQSEEASYCLEFTELVEAKKYDEARNVNTSFDLTHCTSGRALRARAVYCAAFGQIKEALRLTEKGLSAHPDDKELMALESRLTGQLEPAPFKFLAAPHTYPAGETPWSGLVAHVSKAGPAIATLQDGDTKFFPRRIHSAPRYRISEVHPHAGLTTRERSDLTKWTVEELGLYTRLPDSSLVIAALKSDPYGGANKQHTTLWRYNGKRFERLPFCRKGVWYSHPFYDPYRQRLLFTSTAEGSSGGSDIWQSIYENGVLHDPEVLGESVNSSFDEAFPSAKGDTLYFSSNRTDLGLGGADLYMSISGASTPVALPFPINTVFDDFNLQPDANGRCFFASNRPMSGHEDLVYTFTWESKKLFFNSVIGTLSGIERPGGLQLHLLSLGGDTIQTVITDSLGQFSLTNVRGMRGYSIVPDHEPELWSAAQLHLTDASGNTLRKISPTESGKFIFELLTPEDYVLERMELADESILDIDILGRYLSGTTDDSKPVLIVLQNSANEEIARAVTDSSGYFQFEAIKPDVTYRLVANGVRADDIIHILDESGQLLQRIEPGKDGGFVYVNVAPNVKQITLTNERREKVLIAEGSAFDLPAIHFDINSAQLKNSGEASLLKLATLMRDNRDVSLIINGHTDSRGNADYNLALSERRVAAVIEALTQMGVQKNRLSGNGYGETKLLNDCGDDVTCSEDDHALNRRIEFQIFETPQQ